MKSTFKVLFYLKKGSEKKNGEVMIMARITIDGKLCQFSTKQSIQPDNWNTAAGKAKEQGCREDKRPFGRHTFFPEHHLPRNAAA